MCEPGHSIVQYPDHTTDDNLPFGGQMDQESRLKAILGSVADWACKVGRWFHCSTLGGGHSMATKPISYQVHRYLPRATDYENNWWNRSLVIDGVYQGPALDRDEAFAAAKTYSDEVVTGSVAKLRRFLEVSITRSKFHAYSYVTNLMEDTFTAEGRQAVMDRFRQLFHVHNIGDLRRVFGGAMKQVAVNCLLGFTRRRKLFLPVWADDDGLWRP
jgi:hypothetical protein